MNPPGGQPPVTVLFRLFAAHNRLRTLLGQAMAGVGLRPDEYAVYSAVRDAGPVRISELARLTGMPLTTVSDYVHAMARRGHLHRSRNPADSRSFLVRMTPEGEAAHATAKAAFGAVLDRVHAALPMPEREVERAILALDEAIRQAGEDLIPGARGAG